MTMAGALRVPGDVLSGLGLGLWLGGLGLRLGLGGLGLGGAGLRLGGKPGDPGKRTVTRAAFGAMDAASQAAIGKDATVQIVD